MGVCDLDPMKDVDDGCVLRRQAGHAADGREKKEKGDGSDHEDLRWEGVARVKVTPQPTLRVPGPFANIVGRRSLGITLLVLWIPLAFPQHAQALECPEGSVRKESSPPQGKRVECVRSDGLRHGPFEELHPDGGPRQRGAFRNGREVGLWQKFHLNGWIRNEARFRDGVLHGLMRSWYEDGTLNEIGFVWNGKLHGRAHGFHADGSLGERGWYLHDKRDGLWESYAEGGLLLVAEEYRGGNASGPHRSWTPDGQRKAEGEHHEGERVGRWTVWPIPGGSPVIEHHPKAPGREPGALEWALGLIRVPVSPEAR